jgi:transcriptional regulator with GAF, ATPase, and Fis domain
MQQESLLTKRYQFLIEAIDFFSQSLHLEQLIYYGYDLVHQSLELHRSALFIIDLDSYRLKKSIGYEIHEYSIAHTSKHKSIATFYGRILTERFEQYFDPQIVIDFEIEVIIPIIVKDKLVGFIVSDGRQNSHLQAQEYDFAFAINQLMNKAYENAQSFKSLEEKNFELDKKIFNLFFINHSSRLLLAELNIENLYGLCVDIIRELTSSSITSFFVWDENLQKLVLKAYKNILKFDQTYYELEVKLTKTNTGKIVYHVLEDYDELKNIFGDLTPFEKLQAEHVILIVKDTIEGVVTVSKPVNQNSYDKSIFDLIESIMNSIYIALTNAKNFKQINTQKRLLDQQLSNLEQLNRAIKNINTCSSLEEMADIVTTTLHVGFDVECCGVFLKENNDYKLISEIGMDFEVPVLSDLLIQNKGKIVDYTLQGIEQNIHSKWHHSFIDSNCFVLMPLEVDELSFENDTRLGYIMISSLKHALRNEDVLVL